MSHFDHFTEWLTEEPEIPRDDRPPLFESRDEEDIPTRILSADGKGYIVIKECEEHKRSPCPFCMVKLSYNYCSQHNCAPCEHCCQPCESYFLDEDLYSVFRHMSTQSRLNDVDDPLLKLDASTAIWMDFWRAKQESEYSDLSEQISNEELLKMCILRYNANKLDESGRASYATKRVLRDGYIEYSGAPEYVDCWTEEIIEQESEQFIEPKKLAASRFEDAMED